MASYLSLLARFYRANRHFRGRSPHYNRALQCLYYHLIPVLHNWRQMRQKEPDNLTLITQASVEVCSTCRELMCTILGSGAKNLTCTIKVFVEQPGQENKVFLETLARSAPFLDRDSTRECISQPVSTISGALLGLSDGMIAWQRPFPCFSSGELKRHSEIFVSDLPAWGSHYSSILALPIQASPVAQDGHMRIFGILYFDSLDTNVFELIPDTYTFLNDYSAYVKRIHCSATYVVSALMAEIVSQTMYNVFNDDLSPQFFSGHYETTSRTKTYSTKLSRNIVREITNKSHQYYSCFISYSHRDHNFCQTLCAHLNASGIKTWFSPKDIKGGGIIHEQVEEAIRLYDKMIVVLSTESMNSSWVEEEIITALTRQDREGRTILFPISIVPFDDVRQWKCMDADSGRDLAREIRRFYVPEFVRWADEKSFNEALYGLIEALRVKK